jgi:hypothetical protein
MTLPGGHVTAVSRREGFLDIFVVGTDRRVWTAAWTPGTGWLGWFAIPGVIARSGDHVSAVSRGPDQLDIFVADEQGRTMSAAWEPAFTDGWHGWWHIQGGVTLAEGFVTSVSRSLNQLDIFTVGTDFGVYTAAWNPSAGWGGWWPVAGGTARPDQPVWPVSRSTDNLDVFFTGQDQTVRTAAWEPGRPWIAPPFVNDGWDPD